VTAAGDAPVPGAPARLEPAPRRLRVELAQRSATILDAVRHEVYAETVVEPDAEAEHRRQAPPHAGCCPPAERRSCCDAEDEAECCGASGEGCRCR
jgi:hypothetical protein